MKGCSTNFSQVGMAAATPSLKREWQQHHHHSSGNDSSSSITQTGMVAEPTSLMRGMAAAAASAPDASNRHGIISSITQAEMAAAAASLKRE